MKQEAKARAARMRRPFSKGTIYLAVNNEKDPAG